MRKYKNKVIYIGDSRKMKGGVSSVMKILETSPLWEKYHCKWIETQINSPNKFHKILYLFQGIIKGIFLIPQFKIVHFQTTPGKGMKTLFPLFLYTLLWRKKIIVQLHMGNQIESHVNDLSFRFWTKYSNQILFLGHTWEEKIKPYLPKQIKTDFIYNPVHTQIKQSNHEKYFLYTAYFNENKGYDIFLKAFAKITSNYPDWKLIMCGVGDIELVKKCIKECKLEGKVEMPGWVEGEKKHILFTHAGAYCMTSYQEGLPMSVLEAMSYGIPVISTPVGCLPEILQHEHSVLFFNFGNSEELAYCMERIINDNNLRKQLSDKEYNITQNYFSIEKITQKLEYIYNSLL